MSAETAAVLNEAANVIRRNGWTDCGDFYLEDAERDPRECPVCTLGAIAIAVGELPDVHWHDSPEAVAAAESVRRYLNLDPENLLSTSLWERLNLAIGGWNDGMVSCAANVIAVLENAARAERGAES